MTDQRTPEPDLTETDDAPDDDIPDVYSDVPENPDRERAAEDDPRETPE